MKCKIGIMHWFDIRKPEYAYIFGFLQADGHLSNDGTKKGRLSVELHVKDIDILNKFKDIIPIYSSIKTRTRNTNFKKNAKSAIWRCYDQDFRKRLFELGLPVGKKSSSINIPQCKFSKYDYYRGLIDGDGSLGLVKGGWPFLSYITNSNSMAISFSKFLEQFSNRTKITTKNKRDKAYNISITKEAAQTIINLLYYEKCLCIERKRKSSVIVHDWERSDNCKRITWQVKPWTIEEDLVLLSNTEITAVSLLDRTAKSIHMRKWRLKNSVANIKGMD